MTIERDEILERLREELERWEDLLSGLSEEQITNSRLPNGWSIKDLMAHLMAWQQVTRARLTAALRDEPPTYPQWLQGASPESEEDIHRFNARIYEAHRAESWPEVHRAWRDGFDEVLRLGQDVPEDDLMAAGRYPWLGGHPLIAVLRGTYEHHHTDHLPVLQAWIEEAAGG